jgi:hypothetical protein
MCYICGTKRSKAVMGAVKVWGRKKCGPQCTGCDAFRWQGPTSGEASWSNPSGWDLPPKRAKAWTAKDFDAYQKRTRYHLLPGSRPR